MSRVRVMLSWSCSSWMRRCCVLLLLATGPASAEVTFFGQTLLPPTLLPVEFAPTTGIVAEQAQTIGSLQVNPGDYVIAGSANAQAAVVVVALQGQSPTVSPVEILPSLEVYHSTGTTNTGLVRDTLIHAGQVHFIGHSWSADGSGDTEATVWNGATPTGYGFLAGLSESSEFFAASGMEALVGRSALRPVLSTSTSQMEQLPGPDSGTAVGIRRDGRLIVGDLNSALAYWRPDGNGGWSAFEDTLEMPEEVLNAGVLYGAVHHLIHGEALHESGVIIGGIWDVHTGALVELFAPGTAVNAAATLAGHAIFAVNSPGAPNPPQIHVHGQGTIPLLDVFGGDLTGTGIDELISVTDIFPGSAVFLGACESGGQSRHFIGSVAIHPPADFNNDGQVNGDDVDLFRDCFSGPMIPHDPGCEPFDLDQDGDVDQSDFALLQRSLTGP